MGWMPAFGRHADLEIGDTAGLETCATIRLGVCEHYLLSNLGGEAARGSAALPHSGFGSLEPCAEGDAAEIYWLLFFFAEHAPLAFEAVPGAALAVAIDVSDVDRFDHAD